MSRPLELCRDSAELLDDLLLAYVESRESVDPCAISMAADLCRIWGMTPWPKRDKSPVTAEQWDQWKDYA